LDLVEHSELLHQFSESGGRSTILVEQIHGGAAATKTVWLEKWDPDLVLMNLKLVGLYQTGP